jgi:hypothetical protein
MNFLKFYTKLVKNKEKGNLKELVKLKEELEKLNNITEKRWLTEKIKELI